MRTLINSFGFQPKILLIIGNEKLRRSWNRIKFFSFQIRHVNIVKILFLRAVVEHVVAIWLEQILKSLSLRFCLIVWLRKSRVFIFVVFAKVLRKLEPASEDFVVANVAFVAFYLLSRRRFLVLESFMVSQTLQSRRYIITFLAFEFARLVMRHNMRLVILQCFEILVAERTWSKFTLI